MVEGKESSYEKVIAYDGYAEVQCSLYLFIETESQFK